MRLVDAARTAMKRCGMDYVQQHRVLYELQKDLLSFHGIWIEGGKAVAVTSTALEHRTDGAIVDEEGKQEAVTFSTDRFFGQGGNDSVARIDKLRLKVGDCVDKMHGIGLDAKTILVIFKGRGKLRWSNNSCSGCGESSLVL